MFVSSFRTPMTSIFHRNLENLRAYTRITFITYLVKYLLFFPLCCPLHDILSFIIRIYHLCAWNRLIETFKIETSPAAIVLGFTRTRKKRISYEYIKGITFVVKLTPCEAFEKISSTLHRINVKIARCTDTSKHLVSISSPFYHWQLILRDTCCWGEVAFAKVLDAISSS